jgi:hypothetical protein
MKILIVVDEPENCPDVFHDFPHALADDIRVLAAGDYLADPFRAIGNSSASGHRIKVINLCASYRYLSPGYYVSLLAEARGHRPLPEVRSVEDLQFPNLVRHLAEELSELIQRLLAPLPENEFELHACFGHCANSRYGPLSRQLFSLLQIPLLCARFERHKNLWSLRDVRPVESVPWRPTSRKLSRVELPAIPPAGQHG